MKLKQLLKETKVWERKFGESLPTLEDTTKAYKLKLEQEFKAKSKETGRVVVYKSKENMDKAIKGGTAEPLDKKTSDKPEKTKGADLFKKDKPKVWTRVKDGKLKSTGPQQFADDVKNIKGEFDLGGVKIKDGKMFNADGEEMDLDDIEDFYYQDAFDEKGNNVGIDIKEGMIKLKSLLKEGKVWERKFGEPLPTLNSVMEKHQQKEGGKGSGKKSEKTSDKKQKDTEKEMELKAMKQALKDMENESVDEQGILSRRAGINVFGDKKLHLITKNLRQTAFDLEKVAKKKDEQAFDDILQRITITVGVLRSYLNKPKRRM